MYINGIEFSLVSTTFMIGGVPILTGNVSWEATQDKTQNFANAVNTVSVTYGVVKVAKISVALTTQQMGAIRKSSPTGLLMGMPPMNFVMLLRDGALKLQKVVFSDFEFKNDGGDASSDDPTWKFTAEGMASSIQIVGA